eukprot:Pgem_evm1s510
MSDLLCCLSKSNKFDDPENYYVDTDTPSSSISSRCNSNDFDNSNSNENSNNNNTNSAIISDIPRTYNHQLTHSYKLPSYYDNHNHNDHKNNSNVGCSNHCDKEFRYTLPKYEDVNGNCMVAGDCSCHEFGGDCCSLCVETNDNAASIQFLPVNVDFFHFKAFWTVLSFVFSMCALSCIQVSLTWPYWVVDRTTGLSFGLYNDKSQHMYHVSEQDGTYDHLNDDNLNTLFDTYLAKNEYINDEEDQVFYDELERYMDNDDEVMDMFALKRSEEEEEYEFDMGNYPDNLDSWGMDMNSISTKNINQQRGLNDKGSIGNRPRVRRTVEHHNVFTDRAGSLLLYSVRDQTPTTPLSATAVEPTLWLFSLFCSSRRPYSFSRNVKVHRFLTSMILSACGFACGVLLASSSAQFLIHNLPQGYERAKFFFSLLVGGEGGGLVGSLTGAAHLCAV